LPHNHLKRHVISVGGRSSSNSLLDKKRAAASSMVSSFARSFIGRWPSIFRQKELRRHLLDISMNLPRRFLMAYRQKGRSSEVAITSPSASSVSSQCQDAL